MTRDARVVALDKRFREIWPLIDDVDRSDNVCRAWQEASRSCEGKLAYVPSGGSDAPPDAAPRGEGFD